MDPETDTMQNPEDNEKNDNRRILYKKQATAHSAAPMMSILTRPNRSFRYPVSGREASAASV
jgi:hypothetical protein